MSVAIIIPAFNEEKTIGDIIIEAKKVRFIKEVIVVSDGSSDNTAEIASKLGAEVIILPKNIGKGGALSIGVKSTKAKCLVFLDADLLGLKKKHIVRLAKPVMKRKVDMTIGVFTNGKISTDLAQKITPFLSGQRALKRELFEAIDNVELSKYGVEVLFTKYIKEHNIKCQKVELENVTQVVKEKKLGFVKGFIARIKMYGDVIKSFLQK